MSRVLVVLVALLQIAAWSARSAAQNGGGGIGAGGAPAQPARDAARPPTGTASVRGRVTVADTGAPLRRASIRVNFIAAGPGGGGVTTATDDDGRYAIGGLPAGRYTIFATKGGYVGKTSDPFNLADNERRDDVNLAVARGAVIAGTIIDEFGEPVVGAQVMPLRSQFVSGTRRLIPFGGTASTNDIGEYRIFGLDAGQYYVAVTSPSRPPIAIGGPVVLSPTATDVSGYAPTYYPGTPDPSAATRITLAAAQMLNGIDVTLTPIKLASISGVAYDSAGQPITRGAVVAVPDGWATGIGTSNTQVRPDGTFILPGVSPGRYTLRLMVPGPPPPPGSNVNTARPEFSIATVTVAGDDVAGVVLAPLKPVTISGHVVFDDLAAAASIKPAAVRVIAAAIDGPAGIPIGPPPAVNDDFAFQATTAPGLVNLRAAVPNQGQTVWRVKAVRVHGSDVTDSGVELKEGEDVDDVEIEMTTRGQTVSATLTSGLGLPAANVTVLLFSQNTDDWTRPINRYFAAPRTDDAGQFKVSSLPVGDYYAFIAAAGTSSSEWNDPDFLAVAARTARRFSLHEGDNLALDLAPR